MDKNRKGKGKKNKTERKYNIETIATECNSISKRACSKYSKMQGTEKPEENCLLFLRILYTKGRKKIEFPFKLPLNLHLP